MDPLSLIFSAIVSGAAAALKPTAEKVIVDSYEALKSIIKAKFKGVAVEAVERNPASADRQKVLKEDLGASQGLDDREVLEKAQTLLQAVRKHDPAAAEAAGISVKDLDIAGTVNLDDLAAAGNVTVEKIKAGGDFNLRGVRAGNPR